MDSTIMTKKKDQMSESNKLSLLKDLCILIINIFFTILEIVYRKFVPISSKPVKGKIVLITGTGHGIGKEIALGYANLDAIVVCLDINENMNKATVKEIKKLNKSVYAYKCDVSKRDEVFATIKKIKNDVGDVEILINNAGIMLVKNFLDHTEEEIRRTIDINLVAHIWILDAVLPTMIANGTGHVVAISSCLGLKGIGKCVPYCASKFAVRGLMESLRCEMCLYPNVNIKFTTICPSIVDSGLCPSFQTRLPALFKPILPSTAARCIISGQREEVTETTVPNIFYSMHNVLNNLPFKAHNLLADFFGIQFRKWSQQLGSYPSDLKNADSNF